MIFEIALERICTFRYVFAGSPEDIVCFSKLFAAVHALATHYFELVSCSKDRSNDPPFILLPTTGASENEDYVVVRQVLVERPVFEPLGEIGKGESQPHGHACEHLSDHTGEHFQL